MTAMPHSYPPIIQYANISRLQISETIIAQIEESPAYWTTVHENIQLILSVLDAGLRSTYSDVAVSCNRTRGAKFSLFSYRVFSLNIENVDAVVVGITIDKHGDGYNVQGDISGEEVGRLFYSVKQHYVGTNANTLDRAVEHVALQLSRQNDVVVKALTTHIESE